MTLILLVAVRFRVDEQAESGVSPPMPCGVISVWSTWSLLCRVRVRPRVDEGQGIMSGPWAKGMLAGRGEESAVQQPCSARPEVSAQASTILPKRSG